MKTKLTKEQQHEMREKVNEIVLSSRFEEHIREHDVSEQLLGDIANVLWDMRLEESVIDALIDIPDPSEKEIFLCVAGALQRQAHRLKKYGKILKMLSKSKIQAVGELEADCPTG